jgi:predicted nucleotidyltransferase
MGYDLNIFEQKNEVCANMIDKKQHNRQTKSFLKNREEITFAYLFGSFVDDQTFNDVDIAIYVNDDGIMEKVFMRLDYRIN